MPVFFRLGQKQGSFSLAFGLFILRPMKHNKLFRETRILFPMALPLIISQIGQVSMGVVDIIMVGHYHPRALAAVTMGSSLAFGLLLVAMGILMALDPFVSQNFSRKKWEKCGIYAKAGLFSAIILSLPMVFLFYYSEFLFDLLRQKEEIIPLGVEYLRAFIPGVFPFLIFISFRQVLQCLGKMKAIMVVVLLTNIWNFFANWVLIYGNLGFPEWGVWGAGLATTSSEWAMALGVGIYAYWCPLSRRIYLYKIKKNQFLKGLKELLWIGFPIGIQLALEVWAFTATTFLMGTIGAFPLAGHQIALNLASLVFMIPVGLGAAACVRIGHLIGQKNKESAKTCVKVTLFFSLLWSCISATSFYFIPHLLAAFYTPNQEVQNFAIQFLKVAALFQFSDGLQVVGFSILRGMGDTRHPMIFLLIGYWFLGIPFGIISTFYIFFDPVFLWWGLVIGLSITALLLWLRIRKLLWSSLENLPFLPY
ncbi:MAG: MATE family efflux transporter [Planctomycetota bacterium]|nr:MAG: MATE family efflux transporter [Planctomycetota bacterium]